MVEAHNGQPLRLYVYNSNTDSCRDVTLIPNLSWGGSGMLGCEIGFGYLHRIPPQEERLAQGVTSQQVALLSPAFSSNEQQPAVAPPSYQTQVLPQANASPILFCSISFVFDLDSFTLASLFSND